MFGAFRRGPASVVRPAVITYTSSNLSQTCRRPLQLNISGKALLRILQPSHVRALSTASQFYRYDLGQVAKDVAGEAVGTASSTIPGDGRPTEDGLVTSFAELAERNMVAKTVVDTLTKDMRLETMTEVQSLTINESLKGGDILAQARTGTGKTLAFLLPVLQNILQYDPALEKRGGQGRRGDPTDIRAIIISPTRELAEQIAVEARKLTRNTGVIVQTAVGGNSKAAGLRAIRLQGCHMLVGTPGRLNDLLSDPRSGVRAPNLSAFVLDEADRLLDQGFAPDIQEIQNLLPSRQDVDRQTLLYSATVPREVMQIVRKTMKPNFKFVRTVQEGEAQTHEKVPQKLVNVGGLENMVPALVELAQSQLQKAKEGRARPFKAIVYFSATAEVSLTTAILKNLRNPGASLFHEGPLDPAQIIEIHAKLSQEARTRAANAFRRATSGILLSSDVTARGMDFPDVTHVIQMGLPPNQEQYVHRIGRTARAGKEGEAWLLISDLEQREMRQLLKSMPLQIDKTLETAKVDMSKDAQIPESTARILTQVGDATRMVPRLLKVAAYLAAIGVYNRIPDKQRMVDMMNARVRFGWGMDKPPSVAAGMVQKLGLRHLDGLEIGYDAPSSDDRGSSSFGDRRDSRGSGGFQRNDRGSYAGNGRRSFEGTSSYSRDSDRSSRRFTPNGRGSYGDRNAERVSSGGYGGFR